MTRLVHRPIVMIEEIQGEPRQFHDAEVAHHVFAVIDHWIEMGEWWNGEGKKLMWRVLTVQGGVFDLEWNQDEQWSIYRVWD